MSAIGEPLGVAYLELRTDQKALDSGLASARAKTERSLATTQAAVDRRMTAIGTSMSRTGGALTRSVTAPIVALGGVTALMSANFDRAMEMIHTQAGASQHEVDTLKAKVLDLARTLPQSPQQLAEGLFHLESIGLRGAKAMDALKIAAQGAAVGNTDLESTATALGSAWLVNIKGAGNLKDVMGILNATVGAGNVKMGDLVNALGTGLLPAAKIAGLSIQDVMGALAVFTDEGYQASSASAQMATALHFLYAPTQKAADALKSIGLGSTSLATDMRKPQGLLVALTDLHNHLDGLSKVKQEQILNAILPAGRGRILLTLFNQLDRYGNKLTQITRNSGKFDEAVRKTMEQPAVKVKKDISSLEADAIVFGEHVLPILVTAFHDAVGVVDGLGHAFDGLSPGMKRLLIEGGLAVASIGPALKIAGIFTTGIGKLIGIAKIAAELAGGGGLKALGGLSSANKVVASMEVGEMIVKSMIGGPGGGGPGGGALATAEKDAAKVGEGAAGASILSRASAAAARWGPLLGESALPVYAATGGTAALVAYMISQTHAPYSTPQAHQNVHATVVEQNKPYRNAQGDMVYPAPTVVPRTIPPSARRQAGTPGAPVISASQLTTAKYLREINAELGKLQDKKQGVEATASALDDLAVHARKAGDVSGAFSAEFGAELLRTRSVTSRGVQQVIAQMEKLKPGARLAATQGMLAMTQTLVLEGRLPVNATAKMTAQMIAHYKDTRDKGHRYFQGLMTDTSHLMDQLRYTIAHSTGQQHDKAVAEYRALRDDTAHAFTQMLNHTGSQMDALSGKIQHGSQTASNKASGYLKGFAANVQLAMDSGVLSANDGAKQLAGALQKAVKAFGGNPIPGITAVLQGSVTADVQSAVNKITTGFLGLQGGGLLQLGHKGDVGPDSIPLNVGGTNVRAAPGEQVAFLNRHQRPMLDMAVNRAFRMRGGLDEFFDKVDRPHNMTSGGFLSRATGGYVYPFPPGTTIGRTDEGIDANMPVGAPIGAIGDATVMGVQSNWYKGQPLVWERLNSGPMSGHYVYLAEQIANIASGHRTGNQALASYAPSGTGIEMGWATASGQTLAQATTGYTEGQVTQAGTDFRNFILGLAHGVIAGGAVGGPGISIPTLKAPRVRGGGNVGRIVQQMLNRETRAANSYLTKHAAGVPFGSVGGTGNITASNLDAIARGLGYGWSGGDIQAWLAIIGQESGGNPLAQNPTSTAFGIGQFLDSTWGQYGTSPKTSDPHLQLVDMAKYIHGKYGTPTAAEAYHLAHNSYARGGLLPLLLARAGGGGQPGKTVHSTKVKTPHKPKGVRVPTAAQSPNLDKAIAELNAIIGDDGKVAALDEQIGQLQSLEATKTYLGQRFPHLDATQVDELASGTFVVATDAQGNALGSGPFVDNPVVTAYTGMQRQLLDMEYGVQTQLRIATRLLPRIIRMANRALREREERIAAIKRRIKHNLVAIANLTDQITSLKQHGTPDRTKIAQLKANIARMEAVPSKYRDNQRIGELRAQVILLEAVHPNVSRIGSLTKEIDALKGDNAALGGDRDKVGTGGNIGELSKQITAIQQTQSDLAGEPAQLHGVSGQAGMVGDTRVAIDTIKDNLMQVSPSALAQALAAAQANNAPDTSQVDSLLQQQLLEAQQRLAVSQAELSVFAGAGDLGFARGGLLGKLPPFGGVFHEGGVVPGPLGAERTIIAKGGEQYLGAGAGHTFHVVVHDGAVDPRKIEVIAEGAVQKVTRRMSRNAGRRLPGRGGR